MIARAGAAVLAVGGGILFVYLALVGGVVTLYGLADGAESAGTGAAVFGALLVLASGVIALAVHWLAVFAFTGRSSRPPKRLVAAIVVGSPIAAMVVFALLILRS